MGIPFGAFGKREYALYFVEPKAACEFFGDTKVYERNSHGLLRGEGEYRYFLTNLGQTFRLRYEDKMAFGIALEDRFVTYRVVGTGTDAWGRLEMLCFNSNLH